jgi:hypothetical protein
MIEIPFQHNCNETDIQRSQIPTYQIFKFKNITIYIYYDTDESIRPPSIIIQVNMNVNNHSSHQAPLPAVRIGQTSNHPATEVAPETPPTNENIPVSQLIQPTPPNQLQQPSLQEAQSSSSSVFQANSNTVPQSVHNNIISQSQLDEPYDEDDTFISLYHEEQKYYVLKQYCLPTSAISNGSCRFPNRFCVVARTKALTSGTKLSTLSDSVYFPNPNEKKPMKYQKIDARVLKCVLRTCVDCVTDQSKIFHFCCYAHDVSTKSGDGLNMVECTGEDDVLLDHITKYNTTLKDRIVNFSEPDGKLVFPLCTKRCYNSLAVSRHKEKKKRDRINQKKSSCSNNNSKKGKSSDNSPTANWDRDGGDGKKPSIVVLVDWITTEENLSNYYGGLDTEGNTNGNRKDSYHKIIASIIKQENGKSYNSM